MSRESTLDQQLEFLAARGASDHAHSLASLIDHLNGTREILASWGAPPALCTAGLFHSVYGTESFESKVADLADRDAVRELIGPTSEEIAYTFAIMSQESLEDNLARTSGFRLQHRITGEWFDIDREMLAAICNLSAANWLEQLPRLAEIYREMGRARYEKMQPFLLPEAAEAIRSAYGEASPTPS